MKFVPAEHDGCPKPISPAAVTAGRPRRFPDCNTVCTSAVTIISSPVTAPPEHSVSVAGR